MRYFIINYMKLRRTVSIEEHVITVRNYSYEKKKFMKQS